MTAPLRLRGDFDPFAFGGYTSLLYDHLEWVPDLQPGPLAVEVYARMRKDSRLSAILAGYTLQIRRASWQVEPGPCRPEVVQLVADDLGLPIAGRDEPTAARTRGVSWHEHLRSALLILSYGHMCFEAQAQLVDGRARLVSLAERMPWSLTAIHADPKSNAFLGVSQVPADIGDTPQIKADRLAFYTHDRENTWFGTPLIRSSYPAWLLKHELMRVHSTSARRFGMGVPVVEWDKDAHPTQAQVQEAQKMASAARVGDQAGASMPPGASLVLRGLSGDTVDVLSYLKWLNQEMAQAALMPHLDLGTSESGSRALGTAFIDNWVLALGAIAEEVADVATRQIAARVVGWNWNDEPVPRIIAAGVGAQRDVTADSLNLLLGSGALSADPALESWIRREWRLPERAGMVQPAPSVRGDTIAAANPRPRRRTTKPDPAGQLTLPLGPEEDA